MLLAYSRRSHRGEHALLSYPKAGNWLNCCRRLIKKDIGPLFISYWGWGVGGQPRPQGFSLKKRWGGKRRKKIECPILFLAPRPNFLFHSAAAGQADLHSLFFLCLTHIRPFNNFQHQLFIFFFVGFLFVCLLFTWACSLLLQVPILTCLEMIALYYCCHAHGPGMQFLMRHSLLQLSLTYTLHQK